MFKGPPTLINAALRSTDIFDLMVRIILRITLVIFSFIALTFAQINDWTSLFSIEPADSTCIKPRFTLTSENKTFRNTMNFDQNLHWIEQGKDSVSLLDQQARYVFGQDVSSSRNNYLDLSGKFYGKRYFDNLDLTPGLMWSPHGVLYSRAKGNGNFNGTVDVGPTLSARPVSIPVYISGGISTAIWDDSVPKDLFESKREDMNSDVGFYADAKIGAFEKALWDLPLHLSASGFGRYMETSNKTSALARALWATALGSDDSLFAYFSDTLAYGRDGFLGEVNGVSRFISTTNRNEQSLQFAAGFKGKERFFISPFFRYSFSRYALTYPKPSTFLGDRTNSTNMINAVAKSDSLFGFVYAGGLLMSWENEDKLPDADLSVADAQQRLNFQLKDIGDYSVLKTAMRHELSRNFSNGCGGVYLFEITRLSKKYLHSYGTLRSDDDNDRILMRHRLEMWLPQFYETRIGVFGEYSKTIIDYIRSTKSGGNTIDSTFRVGLMCSSGSEDKLLIKEILAADAKLSRFQFPTVHLEDYPDYSRRLESKLILHWTISQRLSLTGFLRNCYDDQGYWYGLAYSPIDTLGVPTVSQYYGITQKTWENSLRLSVVWMALDNLNLSTGALFHDLYYREFDDEKREYLVNTLGSGYVVEPFLEVEFFQNEFNSIKALFKRYIDTIANDYWNISLSLSWQL